VLWAACAQLYGRDEDVQSLCQFASLATTEGMGWIVIDGQPGAGKSALLDGFRSRMGNKARCIAGKFQQFFTGSPYTALRAALDDFLTQAFALPEPEFRAMRQRINTKLTDKLALICEVVPGFRVFMNSAEPSAFPSAAAGTAIGSSKSQQLLKVGSQLAAEAKRPNSPSAVPTAASSSAGAPSMPVTTATSSSDLSPDAEMQFSRAFIELFAVIGTPSRPLIVIQDDLQWATAAPLRLLESILKSGVRNVLVVSAYRSGSLTPQAAAFVEKVC
jgi:predicted ATPase